MGAREESEPSRGVRTNESEGEGWWRENSQVKQARPWFPKSILAVGWLVSCEGELSVDAIASGISLEGGCVEELGRDEQIPVEDC